jgi:hypothetical protein
MTKALTSNPDPFRNKPRGRVPTITPLNTRPATEAAIHEIEMMSTWAQFVAACQEQQAKRNRGIW